MECSLSSCKNPATEDQTCENCYLPKYCSSACRALDAESHVASCRPHLFTLKDFVTVKDSQKILGTGTYGEVQLVQRIGSKTLYALKIIKKSLAASVVPLKVLFREIAVHKTLNHPNIVRLLDHLEDRAKLYLVLEYVEKGSLFDLIRKKIKLSEQEACDIFTQICTGLNYLHKNNLLHRDLKAENLLISQNNIVKICDFGWSAQSGETRQTFCGTLDYMSPEMLRSQPHTYKVDIWALGILLYEMLHGSSPFRAPNPKSMLRLISENRYSVGNHVSVSARELIARILQEDPEARPSINDILKSQWVQQRSQAKIMQDWRIVRTDGSEGIVREVQGLVCTVDFSGIEEELIESEIYRLYTIQNQVGEIISDPFIAVKIETHIDPEKGNSKISPMYKKLGIDSGNQLSVPYIKPAIKTSSARNSRNNSPGVRFDPTVTFEPQKKGPPGLPKSPKAIEEVKRSQQLPPRRVIKHDFEGINLSPEPLPLPVENRAGTPKSSRFLQKWNAGIRPN